MTFKEAVKEILPVEETEDKKPRLKTPTLMQAVLLPMYKVPQKKDEPKKDWNQPHLQMLKYEIIYCSVAMLVCPFTAFFIVQGNEHL